MKLAVCIACSTIRLIGKDELNRLSNLECRACASWGFLSLLDLKSGTYENGVYVERDIIIS